MLFVHPETHFLIRGPTPKALPEVMLFNYGLLYSPIPECLSSRNNDFLKKNDAILRPGTGLPVGEGMSSIPDVPGNVPNPYGIWNGGKGWICAGKQPLSSGLFGIRTKPGGWMGLRSPL